MMLWRQILSWAFLVCLTAPVMADKLAFVLGIDSYEHLDAGAQLKRAVSDATAVGDALQSLGFQVSRITENPTLDVILNRFDLFKATIQPGDTVVFYYAGHGVSLDDGLYSIPADIPALAATDERRAKRLAIAEHDFSRDIRNAGARVAVMVIDACRNNPFPVQGRALGDTTRGLARLETAQGAFTLYAAREGQSALDRLPGNDTDPNSVFTRVLLKEMKLPGISLSELGDRVRDDVAALARSHGYDQVPAVYNDLLGSRTVFLNNASPTDLAPEASNGSAFPQREPSGQAARSEDRTAPEAQSPDAIAWSFIDGTKDPKQIERFLSRFPASDLRQEASSQLTALRQASVALLPPPTTPPVASSVAAIPPATPAVVPTPRGGWIGIRIQDVRDADTKILGLEAKRGALVATLADKGPGKLAGLMAGDVILTVDGKDVIDSHDLARVVTGTPPGTEVTFGILRNAMPQSFRIRVEPFPDVRTPTLEATTTSVTALKPETLAVFGMHLSELTSDLRKTFGVRPSVRGVLVSEIDSGSPASERAIKPGDVVVEVNQEAVVTTADVGVKIKALRDAGKRSALLLVLNGQGEVRFVALALD